MSVYCAPLTRSSNPSYPSFEPGLLPGKIYISGSLPYPGNRTTCNSNGVRVATTGLTFSSQLNEGKYSPVFSLSMKDEFTFFPACEVCSFTFPEYKPLTTILVEVSEHLFDISQHSTYGFERISCISHRLTLRQIMCLCFIAIIPQKAKLHVGTRGSVLWSSWSR